jgi:cell division protein FtsW (lipid II flippase)
MQRGVLSDLGVYLPMAAATLLLIVLVVVPAYAKTKSGRWYGLGRIPSLPPDRATRAAVTLAAAFIVFVAVDLVSGRAVTQLAGNGVVTAIAVAVVLAALVVDIVVLMRRRSRPLR